MGYYNYVAWIEDSEGNKHTVKKIHGKGKKRTYEFSLESSIGLTKQQAFRFMETKNFDDSQFCRQGIAKVEML